MTTTAVGKAAENCLGRTCMKWTASGELSTLDLQGVLQRLAQVDVEASGLLDSCSYGQNCSTPS